MRGRRRETKGRLDLRGGSEGRDVRDRTPVLPVLGMRLELVCGREIW